MDHIDDLEEELWRRARAGLDLAESRTGDAM
jgi:hypothetical protein